MLYDTISLFGGIRFHHIDLVEGDGIQILLDVYAETLEILRFYPFDRFGEEVSFKGVQDISDQLFLSRILWPIAEQIASGTQGSDVISHSKSDQDGSFGCNLKASIFKIQSPSMRSRPSHLMDSRPWAHR